MISKDQHLKEISFPLGGIGTGCIGLAGDGRLVDWEIFNRPAKGSTNGFTHFAIRSIQNDHITAAILGGDVLKDFHGQYSKTNFTGYGHGPFDGRLYGLPHFSEVAFTGEFPMASVLFRDKAFPAEVNLLAFNPFIPNDAQNSSLPGAFFEIEVKNTTQQELKYQVAFSVSNPYECSRNVSGESDGIHRITMFNHAAAVEDIGYGDLTVATDCETVYAQSNWYRGSWPDDSVVTYWNAFSSDLIIKEQNYYTPGKKDTCTLTAEIDVAPGDCKKVRFLLTWNVPNCHNYWNPCTREDGSHVTWKNYYATVFENSIATAEYALKNWDALYRRTMLFKNALYQTTVPAAVLDAAASNLSVLKSPTVMRLEDGSFYGWEGVHETAGSCEGTCQHVWNYAYALCFLFPELERSIRDIEFRYDTDANGKMEFRTKLPLGRQDLPTRACVDGQMGTVIKCYREWKISGDDNWLQSNWENIKKVLEYAWSPENPDGWDADKDGVLEGRQHHTLDVELFGPSSWLEGMYLAALKAAAEMGEYLGDRAKAEEYLDLFRKGCQWMKDNLFNGKYFIQKVDIADKRITDRYDASDWYWNEEYSQIRYQIGEGSMIDQALAQWHADILGLGEIFDPEQLSVALDHMMQYNFKPNMRSVANLWRIFAVNDESGTIICDYPEGVQKPKIPITYTQETMTGFEYAFAGLLLSQGKIEDGIKVVQAVRNRFDGNKRNPWNEFECGSNYARSMASYALIPILSGFRFDMPRKCIGFNPYLSGNFRAVWSLADVLGVFERENDTVRITVYEGSITLHSLILPFCGSVLSLKVDGEDTEYKFADGKLCFVERAISQSLEIKYE